MRTGYKYARRADYDYAMQVDSDGQHDPMCIPDLIAHAQDWDIVIGPIAGRANTTYLALENGR